MITEYKGNSCDFFLAMALTNLELIAKLGELQIGDEYKKLFLKNRRRDKRHRLCSCRRQFTWSRNMSAPFKMEPTVSAPVYLEPNINMSAPR